MDLIDLLDEKDFISTMKPSNHGIEEEQALIIRADNPQEILDEIANLSHLSWLNLEPRPDQHIVDVYYNTLNDDLKRTSLRIRNVNGVKFVTLKGKNKAFDTEKNSIRSEFEVEWPWETPSPEDIADLFELKRTQVRTTKRIVRDITSFNSKKAKVLAELALDRVTYTFHDLKTATFYEAEIEKKGDHKITLSALVEPFLKKFPELSKWKPSKLSTGKILDLALRVNQDEDGVITSESFDIIAQLAEEL